ncbi:hypothetical protein E0G74_01180 [Salmonella enterica]|nr:hypothetical protein [Salmonella enterica]
MSGIITNEVLAEKLDLILFPENGESADAVAEFCHDDWCGPGLNGVYLYNPRLEDTLYWVVVLEICGTFSREYFSIFDEAAPALECFNHGVAALKAHRSLLAQP